MFKNDILRCLYWHCPASLYLQGLQDSNFRSGQFQRIKQMILNTMVLIEHSQRSWQPSNRNGDNNNGMISVFPGLNTSR